MLSDIEKQVTKLQTKLINYRGPVSKLIRDQIIVQYAAALARHYFPKRADNPAYIAPVVHAFACDLVVAPMIHRFHHLWRYNYDDLDLLAQFYIFSTPSRKYYHAAVGFLPPPSVEEVRQGCVLIGIDLGEHLDELMNTYRLEGARSRVAARVLESIGGLAADQLLNQHYGFLERESHRNLRALRGQGRFRFLRRGRQWMTVGTAPGYLTSDIRQEVLADVLGYRIEVGSKIKIHASVSRRAIEQAKAEMAAMLETESSNVMWQVKRVSDYYRNFHRERRFANATDWVEIDRWVLRRVRKFLRSLPKTELTIYQASKNKPWSVTYLPRRTNFFWNISELNCEYADIWNPYRWPEP